jgi:photosystem II stability/assembly factor-like uncharacterized protein
MANATILYACTPEGLVIVTRPGTLPEWLPPRRVLEGQVVTSVWAEPGPPIRVVGVASGTLIVSENGGRTWTDVEMPAPVASVIGFGEPPMLVAAMQGGMLTSSPDGGATWETLPNLPAAGDILAFYPGNTQLYLIVGRAGESDITLLAGDPRTGEWRPLAGGNISAVAEDATTGKLYIALNDGVRVSANSGESWEMLEGSPADAIALTAIPGAAGKPAAVVAGTRSGLWVSQDGGASWQGVDLGEGEMGVNALARDPERRDRLYAATSNGYLFESGNRGQAWERINPSLIPAASCLFVVRI